MYIIKVDCNLEHNSDSGLNRDNRIYYLSKLVKSLILFETENYRELQEFKETLSEGMYEELSGFSSRKFEVKFIKQVEFIYGIERS